MAAYRQARASLGERTYVALAAPLANQRRLGVLGGQLAPTRRSREGN